MFKTKFKASIVLSIIIIILAVIASAGGILFEDLYRDNDLIKAAWYGNDLVTLFVAVPIMAGALLFCAGGSEKAQLVWLGTLWYMVYNYIFYLYAAAFNIFFLLYVALFTLSAYALIFALMKIDIISIAQRFHPRTPVKLISSYMIFFATLLGGLWIAMSIGFIITGQVPQAILQTDHPTGVVYAADLSLLLPVMVLGAILLWKRRPWGYILSTIVMIKGTTYSLVLIVMSVVAYVQVGQGDPLMPLWASLGLGSLLSLAFLLKNMKANT